MEINAALANSYFNDHLITLIEEKPVEPVICSVTPSGVDLSLEPNRRKKIDIFGFDLQSAPITASLMTRGRLIKKDNFVPGHLMRVFMRRPKLDKKHEVVTETFTLNDPISRYRHDVTNSLSIISQYHAVLDLTKSGVDVEPNAQNLVLSWNGNIKSEIPILSKAQVVQCKVETIELNPGKQTFTPPALKNNKCGAPDKEFDGNGPCVKFHLQMQVSPDRKKLIAKYSMDAWECPNDFSKYRKDCTEAKGDGKFDLYHAKRGETILGYDVDHSFNFKYIDDDETSDDFGLAGSQPVERLIFTGDTSGDDAGTDTNVNMYFRTIHMRLEKCGL